MNVSVNFNGVADFYKSALSLTLGAALLADLLFNFSHLYNLFFVFEKAAQQWLLEFVHRVRLSKIS